MSWQYWADTYANKEEKAEMSALQKRIKAAKKVVDELLDEHMEFVRRLQPEMEQRMRDDQVRGCSYCSSKTKGTNNCANCGAPR